MDKLKFETPDMVAGNIEKIGALFPSAMTEMRGEDGQLKKGINFEVLKQLLSRDVVDGDERYEFTWVGKKAAMAEAARPITRTLRPVKEDSRDWDTTENLYIEGDNLEVLKILQESYLGKVKMIYIDPPYNRGHDFIYPDSFVMDDEEYSAGTGYFDEDGNVNFARENTANAGKYHSDWCSMMYARLTLARNLINNENGVVAISIGYQEVNNLMQICQEVFTEMQMMAITVQTSGGKPNGGFNISQEYLVLIMPKDFVPISAEEDMKEYSSPYHGMNLATFDQVERPNQVYPIYVNAEGCIVGCGKTLQEMKNDGSYKGSLRDYIYDYSAVEKQPGVVPVWPITSKGDQCVWRLIPSRLMNDWSEGYIKVVPQKNGKNKYSIQYLSSGIIDKIKSGEIETYRISDNPLIPTLEVKNFKTAGTGIGTIWTDKRFYTANGNIVIKELFGNKSFSYPKPLDMLLYIIRRLTINDDCILDFFSGSATTAHAVMKLNAEDGGHRKFIMVQLPEPCDEKSEAFKAGYKNICEIGKERIRRAGDKIKADNPLGTQSLDTGFRVFRVDESNMKDVYYHPDELEQQSLPELVSNIKDDRTDLDLLYACLLDWGVEINLPHTSTQLDGCTVHNVDNGALMACFNPNVPTSVVEYMAKQQPLRAVFRDSAFASDDAKINVTEIFKNMSPDTKVKVI